MPKVRVRIVGKDRQHLADARRVHHVGVVRSTVREARDGRWIVDAVTDEDRLDALRAAGYEVTELDRGAPVGAARTVEARTEHGYLSVDAVEAQLAEIAEANSEFVELIALPHQTWEGRTCHAVRVGAGSPGGDRPGVCLLGGVHAREWGSPDVLIELVRTLAQAYTGREELSLGGYTLQAAGIAGIVERLTLYVFPQANPDGRHHSMTVDALWRKNRRPPPPGSSADDCYGVDVNRNFDFLWDFETTFDPRSDVSDSANACDPEVYHGPAAASEPETRNVVRLIDGHPDIAYFVDVHSYGEMILYSWGDDNDQNSDPDMNFRNPAYNGRRGVHDSGYGEFLDAADRARAVALAEAIRDGIAASRGSQYRVQQAMDLYPTSGTSDDYAFSRHLVDDSRTKVMSFTVEWGSGSNTDPFHPAYSEMAKIISEVVAGMLELCRVVTP